MGNCIISHSSPVTNLLWTNPDTTVNFSPQNINLGGISYKYLIVIVKNTSGGGVYNNSLLDLSFTAPSESTNPSQIIMSLITGGIVRRYVAIHNINGDIVLQIREGVFTYTNSSGTGIDTVNNSYAIPTKIYGIK